MQIISSYIYEESRLEGSKGRCTKRKVISPVVGSCQLSVVEKKWRRKVGGETPGRLQQFTKETPQGPVVQKEDPTVGSGGIVSCHYCGGVGGGRGGEGCGGGG